MKGLNPKVSIIVPCYNHEQYVGGCLNSILNQTYRNIELIVLDDGSSDGSARVIESYAEGHQFIFEAQENIGLSATINKGMSISSGVYVIIFASDDLMMLDRVEKQVLYMEGHPDVGVCGGNFLYVDDFNQVLGKQKIQRASTFDFDDLFWKGKGGPSAPTAMVRRSAIEEVGGYNPSIAVEDLYMWLKIARRGYKVAVINDVLAYYRKHDSNSHENYAWLIENVLKIYAEYKDHFKFDYVVNNFLASMFLKTSDRDKKLAFSLLFKIRWAYAPNKIFKGVLRLFFKWS